MVRDLVGEHGPKWANEFMQTWHRALTHVFQLTTDGLRIYAEAVEGAFGMDVDYAMLIKLCGSIHSTRSIAPENASERRQAVLQDSPNPKQISTSFVERSNLQNAHVY